MPPVKPAQPYYLLILLKILLFQVQRVICRCDMLQVQPLMFGVDVMQYVQPLTLKA